MAQLWSMGKVLGDLSITGSSLHGGDEWLQKGLVLCTQHKVSRSTQALLLQSEVKSLMRVLLTDRFWECLSVACLSHSFLSLLKSATDKSVASMPPYAGDTLMGLTQQQDGRSSSSSQALTKARALISFAWPSPRHRFQLSRFANWWDGSLYIIRGHCLLSRRFPSRSES